MAERERERIDVSRTRTYHGADPRRNLSGRRNVYARRFRVYAEIFLRADISTARPGKGAGRSGKQRERAGKSGAERGVTYGARRAARAKIAFDSRVTITINLASSLPTRNASIIQPRRGCRENQLASNRVSPHGNRWSLRLKWPRICYDIPPQSYFQLVRQPSIPFVCFAKI